MNDRARIHQRARERIAAGLGNARKRLTDDGESVILPQRWEYADRQPRRARCDRDLIRAVLARQPGQGAGLRKTDRLRLTTRLRRMREDDAPERSWREKYNLVGLQAPR